jgi:O-antigen ligase
MLLPLALYLAQKERGGRRWLWLLAALVLMLGAQATISRTFAIMAIVIGIVYLLLRPRETIRFWPAIIPLLIVVHFALPNTLGILKRSLLPSGGVKTLIAEQGGRDFNPDQHGRIAKIDPTLEKISPDPLFGVGYGTQVLEKPQTNALILDDQWLGTLLESGLVGALGWLWLFALFVTRLGREARRDTSDRGSLLVAACAAIAAFAASMFLYDAFAFIQVTFLLFIMFGIGAVALAQRPGTGEERAVAGGPGRPT